MRSELRIIDADVHPWVPGDIEGLKPYMSQSWQKRFDGKRAILPDHPLRPPLAHATSIRQDTTTPSGEPGGSCPLFLKEDHLDRLNLEYAVLSSIQAGKLVAYPNAGEAMVLATAFNDYFIDKWLPVDKRYKLAMCVAVHDPVAAAAEIRRIGGLPDVVAVYMPLMNILMGNPHYYPIYEAAQEFNLPIFIHPTGTEGGFQTSASFAGGVPSTYIERHSSFPQIAIGNLSSLLFEGVFVRFPRLKVLAAEFGYGWVPHMLWRFDQNWKQFRREVPWLEKLPSSYVLDHVRFTSQPVEEPEKDIYLEQILEMMHADRTLLFSTDYPHWDSDYPATTFTSMSDDLRQKVFHDNAAELFNLKSADNH